MLHVETRNAPSAGHLATRALRRNPGLKPMDTSPSGSIRVTYSTVEIQGAHLCQDPKELALAQLAAAIRQAKAQDKSELMICDITPGIIPGQAAAARVPLVMKKIQSLLETACEKSMAARPECRLDLHHGQFGIRCYLGHTKPTDFTYEEDRLSDSR